MSAKQATYLTNKELTFIDAYMETGNITQSAIRAGYSEKTAAQMGSKLFNKVKIKSEIEKRQAEIKNANIATAQEVMEYFTRVMNGEEKDQFGLEASLGDRTKAAMELAKRTIDIENKLAGKSDASVTIKLDWNRD